ncbi:MAG: hypothetical protein LBN22_06520 [Clostridiales Family XIII bacterium]|nr:hypothetical protein [Clostridiales Family XIII bacterium]
MKKLSHESDEAKLCGWLCLFNAVTEDEMNASVKNDPIYKDEVICE